MAIVFVHGVNNRKSDGFDERAKLIGAFLSRYVGNAFLLRHLVAKDAPDFPYWGDHAAKFAWNMASLPGANVGDPKVEHLGLRLDRVPRPPGAAVGNSVTGGTDSAAGALEVVEKLPLLTGAGSEPLLSLARSDFAGAMRVLLAASVDRVRKLGTGGVAEDLAALNIQVWEFAQQFGAGKRPDWLIAINTDEELVNKVLEMATAQSPARTTFAHVETFGLVSDARHAIVGAARAISDSAKSILGGVVDAGGRALSTAVLDATREGLNANMGRFFGDVFVYLMKRLPGPELSPIQAIVVDAFKAARARADANKEPLVVIGHSLGGVLTYDVLTSVAKDIKVDLFVSVGSQVSHFEEQKLYLSSDKNVATPSRAKMPSNISRWLNVYDPVDIFSYRCEPVFEGVEDFEFDTGTYVIKAHGAYFDQVGFYQHLAKRIGEMT